MSMFLHFETVQSLYLIYERRDIRIANCGETVRYSRRLFPSRLVTHSFVAR